MKKRDFCQTLNLLAKSRKELLWPNGGINVSKLATAVGVNQPTIHRMLEGNVTDPRSRNMEKLCRYFLVDRDQLMGEAVEKSSTRV